ncbi:hypothetical protein [Streptomyces sp. ISBFB 2968]|uniref:hypothetical protein n=1 Tax=Streptomyces sp. ISBFB 2968 TaxID=2903527 RepID=UPI002FDC1DFF
MAKLTSQQDGLLLEPPVRMVENVDMSFEDVPYPVVPAFTRRPIVHLAVECQGVGWNRGITIRVLVRTRCGKTEVEADRRCMSWVAECQRCFPTGRRPHQGAA